MYFFDDLWNACWVVNYFWNHFCGSMVKNFLSYAWIAIPRNFRYEKHWVYTLWVKSCHFTWNCFLHDSVVWWNIPMWNDQGMFKWFNFSFNHLAISAYPFMIILCWNPFEPYNWFLLTLSLNTVFILPTLHWKWEQWEVWVENKFGGRLTIVYRWLMIWGLQLI